MRTLTSESTTIVYSFFERWSNAGWDAFRIRVATGSEGIFEYRRENMMF